MEEAPRTLQGEAKNAFNKKKSLLTSKNISLNVSKQILKTFSFMCGALRLTKTKHMDNGSARGENDADQLERDVDK